MIYIVYKYFVCFVSTSRHPKNKKDNYIYKKDNYICKNKDKNKKIFNIYTTDINYCTLLEKLPKIRN